MTINIKGNFFTEAQEEEVSGNEPGPDVTLFFEML